MSKPAAAEAPWLRSNVLIQSTFFNIISKDVPACEKESQSFVKLRRIGGVSEAPPSGSLLPQS